MVPSQQPFFFLSKVTPWKETIASKKIKFSDCLNKVTLIIGGGGLENRPSTKNKLSKSVENKTVFNYSMSGLKKYDNLKNTFFGGSFLKRLTSAPIQKKMAQSAVQIVEVYKWIVLALSIGLNFWLRWLVHEA
jgi:hypothetical protein